MSNSFEEVWTVTGSEWDVAAFTRRLFRDHPEPTLASDGWVMLTWDDIPIQDREGNIIHVKGAADCHVTATSPTATKFSVLYSIHESGPPTNDIAAAFPGLLIDTTSMCDVDWSTYWVDHFAGGKLISHEEIIDEELREQWERESKEASEDEVNAFE